MPSSDTLDKVFTECLSNQAEGHAFYFEVTSKELKPGTCGFLDKKKDWNTIAHIDDQDSLGDLGPALPTGKGNVEITSASTATWGVRHSENVHKFYPEVNISTNILGAPVSGGITIGYKTENETGAILMTKGKITESKAKPEHRIVGWMTKERAEAIMKKYPDTRDNGIWIATKTYTAKTRALAVLQTKQSSATFGVDLNLWSVATVSPSVEWWNSQKDSMWVMHENDEGIVLFMSGIWWRPRWLSKELKPEETRKEQKWMAPGDKAAEIEVQLDNGPGIPATSITLVPEAVGDSDVFEPEEEMRAVQGDYESEEEMEEIMQAEEFEED